MLRSVPPRRVPLRAPRGSCAAAGVPVLSQNCNHRAAPLKLVTELCINLTHSLNPDIYKYVRNTNSHVLSLPALCAQAEDVLCTHAGCSWWSSRGEVAAQQKFLGSNHRFWKEQVPFTCRSSTEWAESQPCTGSAGIAGRRPLWIKVWVINPAGSQTHLPFPEPASSVPSALHRRVPTESSWVQFC